MASANSSEDPVWAGSAGAELAAIEAQPVATAIEAVISQGIARVKIRSVLVTVSLPRYRFEARSLVGYARASWVRQGAEPAVLSCIERSYRTSGTGPGAFNQARAAPYPRLSGGNSTETVSPPPTRLRAWISPPCSSMMRRAIGSPRPVPVS